MNKTYKQVVHEIKAAEQNVDEVLKAAKLARYQRQPRLDSDGLFWLLATAMVLLFFLGFVALLQFGG